MKRFIETLILAGIVILVSPSPLVKAFTTSGNQWDIPQAIYYINPNNITLGPAIVVGEIDRAAAAWNTQGGTPFRFINGGFTSADAFVNDGINTISFKYEAGMSWIAYTRYVYDGAGHILDMDTEFNLKYLFFANNTGCSGKLSYYLQDIMAHEFGHWLSLGHSTDSIATMYGGSGSCELAKETLSRDDALGIRSLYGWDGVTPLPVDPTCTKGCLPPPGSSGEK